MNEKETLIKNRINKVIDIAKSEVGYTEKKNNITKYGTDFDTKYKGFYYGSSNPCEWCDLFFDWCMVTAFGIDLALKMLYQPKKSYGRSCTWSYNYYKEHNSVGETPKLGAQIFFKNSKTGKICHTGRVTRIYKKNNKEYIETVEGNKNNSVSVCNYPVSSTKIYGYGYPDYGVDIGIIESPINGTDIKKYKVIAISGLRIRKEASDKSKIIKVLPFGTEVEGTVTGNWLKVKNGYMSMKFLKEI